jgi:hypothetical protein
MSSVVSWKTASLHLLAGVAEHDLQDVGLPPLAIRAHDWGPRAEVDLGFLTQLVLDAMDGEAFRPLEPVNKAPHGIVATSKTALADQILVDSLGPEAKAILGLNEPVPRLTAAGPTVVPSL